MNPTDNQVPGAMLPHAASGAAQPVQPSVAAQAPNAAPALNQASPALKAPDNILEAAVRQARALTAQYAADPYTQVRELEKLKAAYISQEFGKTIKVADE
jgi:aspartate/methionine/tyrosine aminotransferase